MNSVPISVIVPVYNVKKYLSKCLDSILEQTFYDLEIICVDDGSTDGSGELLDEYAKKDSRIRVIHKENGGYGKAMNTGLDAAAGEYIGIVESDDAILPDFYETLYKAVKENDLDIVKSEFYLTWFERDYQFRIHRSGMDTYFDKVLSREWQMIRCSFLMNTWSGLYRREFLNKFEIRHHESPGASYQDNGFWMQGMLFADRVMCLNYAGYLYRQDNENASVKDPNKIYAMADEYRWLLSHLEKRITLSESMLVKGFALTRSYWSIMRIADEKKREFCNRLLDDYAQYGDALVRDLFWKKKFYDLKEDPDGFCEQLVGRKRKVLEAFDQAEGIIVYGAGNRGERLYRIMCDNKMVDRLICFVETGEAAKEKIGKTPIVAIENCPMDIGKCAAVISAARNTKAYRQMRETLEVFNGVQIVDSEELMECFYNFD